jgi:hypothetical protein
MRRTLDGLEREARAVGGGGSTLRARSGARSSTSVAVGWIVVACGAALGGAVLLLAYVVLDDAPRPNRSEAQVYEVLRRRNPEVGERTDVGGDATGVFGGVGAGYSPTTDLQVPDGYVLGEVADDPLSDVGGVVHYFDGPDPLEPGSECTIALDGRPGGIDWHLRIICGGPIGG